MGATIKSVDHGYRALLDRLYGASKTRPVVRVGIQAIDGDQPHPEETFSDKQTRSAKFVKAHGALATLRRSANGKLRDASHDKELLTVLQVATFHEFGTVNIPERSFIRAWFDENEGTVRDTLAKLMRSVVSGKRTKEEVLELLGQWCVGSIQKRMAAGLTPPLKEKTIRQKTRNGKTGEKPLIDTGVLRSSISYRVDTT